MQSNRQQADLAARRGEEVKTMKLNKTLTQMREANAEGGAVTIYGRKMFDQILNFKAVVSCDIDYCVLKFKLTDGSTIKAYYDKTE